VLGVADVLHRHGYQVLVVGLRGHDINDGETISFGVNEVRDMAAWFEYLQRRQDIDRARVGLFGVSMGGSIGLKFASDHADIHAVIADSAFSSVADTAATSIKFFTGLPPFPFAPAIVFWAEREIGGSVSQLDATKWIHSIAPRPVRSCRVAPIAWCRRKAGANCSRPPASRRNSGSNPRSVTRSF
jgi:pimeloyl-ACP methyl ester carboxylesterase